MVETQCDWQEPRTRGRGCWGCGGPKPPGAGAHYCDACRPTGRPKQRRACMGCGGEKPHGQGRMFCDECDAKRKARQPCARCGGEKGPGRSRRLCDTCRNQQPVPGPRKCRICGADRRARRQYCDKCRPPSRYRQKGVPTPCLKCGERTPKRPGAHWCPSCAEVEREATKARKRAKAALRRKRCAGCLGRKGPGEARYCARCQAERSRVVCRGCRERPPRERGKVYCWECWAVAEARERARKVEWMQERREQGLGPSATHRAAQKAEWRRRRARNAERDRRHDISGRIEGSAALVAAIRRAARGEALTSFCHSLVDGMTYRDRRGHERQLTAVSMERAVRRWEMGESVTFDVADRVLTRLGLLWWDVWDEVPVPLAPAERGRPLDVLAYVDAAFRYLEYVQVRRLFEGEPEQWREAA